jgi:transposase
VISSPERRRRWSEDQKRATVAEAFAPGASVFAVARRVDIVPGLIHHWRQEFRAARMGFTEVTVAPDERSYSGSPALKVEFGRDIRVRIPVTTPNDLACAVIKALARGRYRMLTVRRGRLRDSQCRRGTGRGRPPRAPGYRGVRAGPDGPMLGRRYRRRRFSGRFTDAVTRRRARNASAVAPPGSGSDVPPRPSSQHSRPGRPAQGLWQEGLSVAKRPGLRRLRRRQCLSNVLHGLRSGSSVHVPVCLCRV